METNIYDRVLEKLKVRLGRVDLKIHDQFKKQTPFRMKPITDKQLVEIYDAMGEQDWYDALDKFGVEEVDAFRTKAESVKARRETYG
jgi:hypothetical protein